jgi:hypothetical protein
VSVRIDAIRLSGGNRHQHIVHLWWTNPADGTTGDNTRAELVAWIEQKNGKAYVDDRSRCHAADLWSVPRRCRTPGHTPVHLIPANVRASEQSASHLD